MPIRSLLVWGVIALVLVVIFAAMDGSKGPQVPMLTYSAFLDRVEQGDVESVTTQGETIAVHTKTGSDYTTIVPQGTMPDTVRQLRQAGVRISVQRLRQGPTLGDIALGMLPMLLLVGAWFFFMRQMRERPSWPARSD